MRTRILCLFLFGIILLLCPTQAQAQETATLNQDTLYQIQPAKRQYKGLYLLPATFIIYGAASLKLNGLKSVNHQMKEEVYLEGSRRTTHLDNYLQYAPGALVYGLNIVGIKGKHNLVDRTAIYAMANIIMGTTVTVTKQLTHEMRPDGSNDLSFPSGHTATAFAAAEFMMREYQDVSILYGVAGYAMAATTGYLRMSNNRHWWSDIVAGAGVGILSTELAYQLYPSVKKMFGGKKNDMAGMLLPTYQQGAFGLSMVRTF